MHLKIQIKCKCDCNYEINNKVANHTDLCCPNCGLKNPDLQELQDMLDLAERLKNREHLGYVVSGEDF